ncbi:MAG: UDP-3-O-(3-hydroxymyristoyl)glucosamine N-acyltransferase [Pseudomonadota bacterium]
MAIDPRFFDQVGADTVEAWAKGSGAKCVGEGTGAVTGVGAASTALAGDVAFFEGAAKGLGSISVKAAAIFVSEEHVEGVPDGVTALIHDQPRLAFFAMASRAIRRKTIADQAERIHTTAAIHPDAKLGPGVVVGAGAAIGAETVIGANTVIGPGVQIGMRTEIGPNASLQCALIGNDVKILAGARIGEAGFGVAPGPEGAEDSPHFGRAILQDHVTLGANSCVDRGAFDDTVIGERSKLDNFCQVAHNCQLGRNVVVAAFAGISGSVTVRDGAMLGGRVGIADHVTVGTGAQLAASAGVFRDIPDGETWGGTPGRPIRQWMREVAWLQKNAGGKKKAAREPKEG